MLFIAVFLCGSACPCQAVSPAEAYIGQPYGVGRVTVDVLRGQPLLPLSDERFTLSEATGRAMYPVLKEQPGRRVLRQLLQIETPRQVTIYFLFQGDEPFELSVFAPHEQGVHVKPLQNDSAHGRLMDHWWQQVTARLARLRQDPAYPPVAENYIAATFARRLQRALPAHQHGFLPWNKQKDTVLAQLFLTETYQLQVDRELVGPSLDLEPATTPLPQPIRWAASDVLEKDLGPLTVEPLAAHVPAECFYLRFGNFSNYLWFRDLNKKWQGDLANMLLRRGIHRGGAERLQQQLSLRESALAKVLGPQVIADAAIIGLDPYLGQGGALGILFQAKNSFLLSQDLMRQRRSALASFPAAKETTLRVAEQDVSLIATPDGQVRSYYAQREDFHLVTTSVTLARRFLEAGQGNRALATLPGFLRARQEMPLERGDAMFAFVSAEFFQNLCSPQYRIETERRIRAFRERHLRDLATFSAGVEGISALSTGDLIRSDLLPAGFGSRVDGSQLVDTEGSFVDSLRGAPGYFVPVADVPVPFASAAELEAYQRFAQRFQKDIGQMPSIAIGVQRQREEPSADVTMLVDIWATGVEHTNLDALRDTLGEPSMQQLRPIVGDVLAAEVVLDIPVPLIGGESQPHHLFGALRDFRFPLTVSSGAVLPGAPPAELLRGYLGAWPRPGVLEMFTGPTGGVAAGQGPERAGDKLWQAREEDFLLISFKPDVIEQVLPQLAFEDAQRAAQVRVRLQDLTGTQMAHNVNALGYMRSRETSQSASRLMNSLANQLQVPRPECRAVAERLVDGEFVCALGGEYQLFAPERGLEVWLSSAVAPQNRFLLTEVPDDFNLALLTWFRGLDGDLEVNAESLRAHLEIKMTAAALP